MTSPNPIPAIGGLPQPCDNPEVCAPRLGKRRLLGTPFTVSILGLAFAVALWGYGYKLSLYHHHPDKTSANAVAKLWVKERHQAAGARVRTHRDQDSPAQPVWLSPIAPAGPIDTGDRHPRQLSQSQIEFDLFSRPPPPASSL